MLGFTGFRGIDRADVVVNFQALGGANTSEIENAFDLSFNEFLTGDPDLPWDAVTPYWQAILSDTGDGGDARDRLNITAPVYNTNGELVATDLNDLFDRL